MATNRYKPTSPGIRFQTHASFDDITKSRPEKALTKGKRKSGGRNSGGRITSRFIGGGHKQKYREIDFKRDKRGIPAKVAAIEYDPNRTAHIALLHYVDGEKRYILAPNGLAVGTQITAGEDADPDPVAHDVDRVGGSALVVVAERAQGPRQGRIGGDVHQVAAEPQRSELREVEPRGAGEGGLPAEDAVQLDGVRVEARLAPGAGLLAAADADELVGDDNTPGVIVIANVVAFPLAYIMMKKWLATFAYQVNIDFKLFIFSALAAATIAFLTICYQGIRAANANPAEVLKNE